MGEATAPGNREECSLPLRLVPVRSRFSGKTAPPAGQPFQKAAGIDQNREGPKPKLLDQVRAAIRTRHYSLRTEDAYVHWIKRFVLFHGKRHPRDMGEGEISQFLTALAVDGHVSASTQNQALCALLFLYRHVLDLNPGWIDNVVRAKQPHRLPVVLRKHEVKALLDALEGVH